MALRKTQPKKDNTVVDFTTLDDENKTEFLEFLLKNNISFQKSHNQKEDDFVAKVTIDKKNIFKTSNTNKKVTQTTPKGSTNKKPYKVNAKNEKENNCTPTKTPKRNNDLSNKKQNARSANNKSFNLDKNSTSKHRKTTSEFRTPKHGNKEIKIINQSKENQIKKEVGGQKKTKLEKVGKKEKEIQNKIKSNIEIKKKTHDEKQICELFNKYLKVFDLKLNGQRPIKWSIIQTNKFVEEIFNQNFSKTTQQLATGKKTPVHNFIRLIKDFFFEKFKSQKLGSSNLINFLHSMCFHLEKQKEAMKKEKNKSSILLNLQTFEEFVSEIYEQEDLLFYLFVRNIIQKKIINGNKTRKLKTEVSLGKNIDNSGSEEQIWLGNRDISKIVTELVGDDEELIREYKLMILNEIKNRQMLTDESLKVCSAEFLRIVVQDYRNKRILGEQYSSIQTHRQNEKNFEHSLDQNSFPHDIFLKPQENKLIYEQQKLELKQTKPQMFREPTLGKLEKSADELTFGEDTQDKNQIQFEETLMMEEARQFWESEETERLQKNLGSLEEMICEKLEKKVGELIGIIIESQNEFICQETLMIKDLKFSEQKLKFLEKIVNRKAFNLMACVFQMDKMRWFEELRVEDPSYTDIENAEKLQLLFRGLRNNLDAKMIGELCKNILTIPQFTEALETLLL